MLSCDGLWWELVAEEVVDALRDEWECGMQAGLPTLPEFAFDGHRDALHHTHHTCNIVKFQITRAVSEGKTESVSVQHLAGLIPRKF